MSMKRIIIRALLLSVLLHLILFTVFDFRFDSKKRLPRTSFHFLGSFLRTTDMEISSEHHHLSQTKKIYNEAIDTNTSSNDPKNSTFNKDKKPELFASSRKKLKKTLKSEITTTQKEENQLLKQQNSNVEANSLDNLRLKLPNNDNY